MQVSEQIIAVLDNLAQRFGVVIDWSQQNVWPYVQELAAKYIKWEINASIMCLMFGILCIVGCVVGFICTYKYRCKHCDDWEYTGVCTGLFIAASITCGVIGVAWSFNEVLDIIRCYAFPELQIIHYIQGFMLMQ